MDIFFLIVLLLILVFVNVFVIIYMIGLVRARMVPYVKTRQPVYDALLQHVHLNAGDVFIELGCGDAATLSQVTGKFAGIKARGYEIALHPYIRAKRRVRKDGGRYEIIRKSFMRADLSDADVIYCYLMPHFMGPLWKKLKKECTPGTVLYSYAFAIPAVEPETVMQPHPQKREHLGKLFVYRVY